MRKILLVRHGETDWNLEMRFQGREDVPLNKRGQKQAELLARHLEGGKEEIARIYSSSLSRAMTTAKIIGGVLGAEPRVAEDFVEIDFGSWEGRTYSEMSKAEKETLSLWMMDPTSCSIPGGESFALFQERVCRSYDKIIQENAEGNILIVTHSGAIKAVVAKVLELHPAMIIRLKLFPTSLSVIQYDGRNNPYLELFNDICHLREENE